MRVLACTVLTACGHAAAVPTQPPPTPPPAPAPVPPTVAELLSTVAATYSGARTYVDHGVHRVVYRGQGAHESTLRFETAFVRGEHFRFEYREESPANTMIIWSDFEHTYSTWTARPGRQEPRSLDFAIAAATGVSGGTAFTIPKLLMAQDGLVAMHDLRLDGDEIIEGRACWRLVSAPSTHPANRNLGTLATRHEPTTLWIDQRTHLLVRIFKRTHFEGPDAFVSEATTTYEPTLDQPIDPALLAPI